MIEKKFYECEVCHTNFSDKEKAKECEKGHVKIDKISDVRYSAHGKYANKLLIRFEDGHELWFK